MSVLDLVLAIGLSAVLLAGSFQLSQVYMGYADRWTLVADVRRVAAAARRLPTAGGSLPDDAGQLLADSGMLPLRLRPPGGAAPIIVGGRYPATLWPADSATARIAPQRTPPGPLAVPRIPGGLLLRIGTADQPVVSVDDCRALLAPILDGHLPARLHAFHVYAMMPASDPRPPFGAVFRAPIAWVDGPETQLLYRSGDVGLAGDPAAAWQARGGTVSAAIDTACLRWAADAPGVVIGYLLP